MGEHVSALYSDLLAKALWSKGPCHDAELWGSSKLHLLLARSLDNYLRPTFYLDIIIKRSTSAQPLEFLVSFLSAPLSGQVTEWPLGYNEIWREIAKDGWTHQMASLIVIIMPPWVAALNWHREWREGTDLSNPANPFRLAIAFFLSSFPRNHNKISWQSDLAEKSYKWARYLILGIQQERKKDCQVPLHSKCWHNHLVLLKCRSGKYESCEFLNTNILKFNEWVTDFWL